LLLQAFDQAIPLAEAFPSLRLELQAAKVHVGQVSGKGKADTAAATDAAARALLQTVKSQPTLTKEQVSPPSVFPASAPPSFPQPPFLPFILPCFFLQMTYHGVID
jgi:hypothetical protein